MGKSEAGTGVGQDAFLEVRVELVDSEPAIWRQLEVRSTMTLNQVHRVLQAAFGWEDIHLYRFTTGDPFAPLRPVDGEFGKPCSGFPGRSAKNRRTGSREIAPWISCSRWVRARRSTNTTLVIAGFTGSSWSGPLWETPARQGL